MSEAKLLKCESCGASLSSSDLLKTLNDGLLFECSSCKSLSMVRNAGEKPPQKEETSEEIIANMKKAWSELPCPNLPKPKPLLGLIRPKGTKYFNISFKDMFK